MNCSMTFHEKNQSSKPKYGAKILVLYLSLYISLTNRQTGHNLYDSTHNTKQYKWELCTNIYWPVVLLEVAEILVETQEAWLCPMAVALLEDDAAMLQVEVEGVPQDDQKTCNTADTLLTWTTYCTAQLHHKQHKYYQNDTL